MAKCLGRLAALTRLDLIGSCKCSVAVVAANQRSLFQRSRGRVSLTATNITRPTLDFIEEIYHFWFTVSVFVHRTRITFDRRRDCGLRERRRDRGLRERRRDRSFALKKRRRLLVLLADTTQEEEGLSKKHACGRYAYLLCSCLLPLRYLIVVRLDISPFFRLRISHT